MRSPITLSRSAVALLGLVLLTLFADIFIRVQPVHAQNGSTAYLDQIPYNAGKPSQQIRIQGATVLSMSCANNVCNILTQ